MKRAWLLSALWLGLVGCGEESTPGEPIDGGQGADGKIAEPDSSVVGPLTYAPCPLDQKVGGFEVTLASDYTGVNGQVADGVVPGNVPDVVAEAGGCQLLKGRILFCDPPCVPGETCGTDGTCIPYPENHSVGVVTIDGLKSPLVMEAKWGNHYTNPGSMEHPGFDTGAGIHLTAAGGDFEPFQLLGFGVSPLEGQQETVSISSDTGVELSWAAPSIEGHTRVHIVLNINNHGSTSAWIACDAEDTGTFSIPAELIGDLYAIGISGFPSLEVARRSVDSTSITPGCVQLAVVAGTSVPVEVDGVLSCTKDAQCPPGQSCGVDLQCK